MKKTIRKSIHIKADREKVWDTLLQDKTYRTWISVFNPGLYAETNWKEGNKVLFMNPDGDGVVSLVVVHRPFEFISLEHQGIIKNGKEVLHDVEIKDWRGFRETYHVCEREGVTQLSIEQDRPEEYFDSFSKTWDLALQKVKDLSELHNP